MFRGLMHVLGLDDGSGAFYLFWSGIGADLTEFAIVGGLVSVYMRHSCHVRGCWRIGRHPVEGSSWVVCRRHHPHDAPTHEQVLDRHREKHPDA